MINFIVYTEPFGKQRPRFSSRSGRAYTPDETKEREMIIRCAYLKQHRGKKLQGELKLKVVAYFGIPKSVKGAKREAMVSGEIRPTKKPDADNILKLIADSLNKIAFEDDSHFVAMSCEKYYSETPMIEVFISEVHYSEAFDDYMKKVIELFKSGKATEVQYEQMARAVAIASEQDDENTWEIDCAIDPEYASWFWSNNDSEAW